MLVIDRTAQQSAGNGMFSSEWLLLGWMAALTSWSWRRFTTPLSCLSLQPVLHAHTKVEFRAQLSYLNLQPVPHAHTELEFTTLLSCFSLQRVPHAHTEVEFCSQPLSCLSLQPVPHAHTEVEFRAHLFLSHSLTLGFVCILFVQSFFKVWPLISVLLLSITF